MSSNMVRCLSATVMLLILSASTMAEKVIVLFRPGFPDNTAPAQILEQKLGARLVSCLDESALGEIQKSDGYEELIAFDTFLEHEKIATLKEKLAKLNPSTKLIVYIKNGDHAYDALECDEKEVVDFTQRSYLLLAMNKAQMAISDGAKLLDNGLSHQPNPDGKALREYYTTYKSTAKALLEIVEADEVQLTKLLQTGHNFVEKLASQTNILVETASYETLSENGIRLGYQLAVTGVTALGPAIIDSGKKADIGIVLVEHNPFKEVYRYSIRTSDKFSAKKIHEFIKKHQDAGVIRGGGDDFAAGFTCKMAPAPLIQLLRSATTNELRR